MTFESEKKLKYLNEKYRSHLILGSTAFTVPSIKSGQIKGVGNAQSFVTSSLMVSSISVIPSLQTLRETIMLTHNVFQGGLNFLTTEDKILLSVKTFISIVVTKNMKHIKTVPGLNILPNILLFLHFFKVMGEIMKSSLIPGDVLNTYGETAVKLAGAFGYIIEEISRLLISGVLYIKHNIVEPIKLPPYKKPVSIEDFSLEFEKLPDDIRIRILSKQKEYKTSDWLGDHTYDERKLEDIFLKVIPRIIS